MKRTSKSLIGGGLISASTEFSMLQSDSAEGWLQSQYNAKNNAYAPQNTGPSIGQNTEIGHKWRFVFEDLSFGTQPIISGNTIFVPGEIPSSETEKRFGSGLFAFDVETGERQWLSDIGSIWSCVMAGDDFIYVLTGDSIYSLDTEDGSVVWRTQTETGTPQSATIHNSTIYVGTRGESVFESDSYLPASIRALRLDDGSERWTHEFSTYDEQEETIVSLPAVDDDTIYVGIGSHYFEDGDVFALTSSNGEKRWSFSVNSQVKGPTIAGDNIYFGTGGGSDARKLYSLDKSTGTENWRYSAGAVWSPTVVEETVYVGHYSGFDALDVTTGELQWEYEPETNSTSAPAVTSNSIYIADGDTVKAFNRENKELSWSYQLESEVISDPIIVDRSVFVFSEGGVLHAIGESTSDSTKTSTGSGGSRKNPGSSTSGNSSPYHTQTSGVKKQQGTTNKTQNADNKDNDVPRWSEFESPSSTIAAGAVGTLLGMTGVYAVYQRFCGDPN